MTYLTPEQNYIVWHAVSDEQIQEWLRPENLSGRERRGFEGFEIINSIDGRQDDDVEVSLVRISKEGPHPQHIHYNSDAHLVITSGRAIFLSGTTRTEMKTGDRIDVPREMPHGFEIPVGSHIVFVSLQSPPIKDEHTGEEDFYIVD
jgi:mannose-6-phosphate isomerase-like protein (cupin superfamily)